MRRNSSARARSGTARHGDRIDGGSASIHGQSPFATADTSSANDGFAAETSSSRKDGCQTEISRRSLQRRSARRVSFQNDSGSPAKRTSLGTASALRTSQARLPPRYSASSANPVGTAPAWPDASSESGDTDQYAGPPMIGGRCRTRSCIQGKTAALNASVSDAENGMRFRPPVDPLVGARWETWPQASTLGAPRAIRSMSLSMSP